MALARWMAALGTLALFVGCATTALPPPVRDVPVSPEVARARVEDELRRLELQPGPASGQDGIEATIGRASPSWAECRPKLVGGGGDDPYRMSTADVRQGTVTVTFTPTPTGTQVRVTPAFKASYRNPVRGMSFEAPCSSTGELEQRLLDAASG